MAYTPDRAQAPACSSSACATRPNHLLCARLGRYRRPPRCLIVPVAFHETRQTCVVRQLDEAPRRPVAGTDVRARASAIATDFSVDASLATAPSFIPPRPTPVLPPRRRHHSSPSRHSRRPRDVAAVGSRTTPSPDGRARRRAAHLSGRCRARGYTAHGRWQRPMPILSSARVQPVRLVGLLRPEQDGAIGHARSKQPRHAVVAPPRQAGNTTAFLPLPAGPSAAPARPPPLPAPPLAAALPPSPLMLPPTPPPIADRQRPARLAGAGCAAPPGTPPPPS